MDKIYKILKVEKVKNIMLNINSLDDIKRIIKNNKWLLLGIPLMCFYPTDIILFSTVVFYAVLTTSYTFKEEMKKTKEKLAAQERKLNEIKEERKKEENKEIIYTPTISLEKQNRPKVLRKTRF